VGGGGGYIQHLMGSRSFTRRLRVKGGGEKRKEIKEEKSKERSTEAESKIDEQN